MRAIISVANVAALSGKTTVAVNLAAEFSTRGIRTLLIDADPQARATPFFVSADKIAHAYTFTAIDRAMKLILCWHLGRRSVADTFAFTEKLYRAAGSKFQLTTDGFAALLSRRVHRRDEGSGYRRPRLRTHQHLARRKAELDDQDAHAPPHSLYERIQ